MSFLDSDQFDDFAQHYVSQDSLSEHHMSEQYFAFDIEHHEYTLAAQDLILELRAAESILLDFQTHTHSDPGFDQTDITAHEYRLIHRVESLNQELEQLEASISHESRLAHRLRQQMSRRKPRVQPSAFQSERLNLPFAMVATRPTNLRDAWSQNDHETVVRLASSSIEALASAPARANLDDIPHLCAALRYRFKAYQAMHLYSLAVADANRLLELLARFADADVEVDQSLLPISAAPSTSYACPEQVPSSPDTIRGQKRSSTTNLGGQLVKRKRRPNRAPAHNSLHITQLPVEIILMIAEYLDAVDRIRLASTCHQWRSIPQLWQSLEFNRVKATTKRGWHRDTIDACITAIETCQRRSHASLTSVVLKGYLTFPSAGVVLDVLRRSSATLRYLAIPTLDQAQCFEQLYQRCPNLEAIDIRLYTDSSSVYAVDSIRTEHFTRSTSLFSSAKLPFKLKRFISAQEIDCGDIAPHLQGIQVVHGLKHMRQKKLNFIDAIVRAAPTLTEWRDDPENRWDSTTVTLGDYGIGQEQLPKHTLVFPNLRKLSALWSEHFLDCEFPALVEARLNSLRGPSSLDPVIQNQKLRIATIITKSPSLKKLDILLPTGFHALKQIFVAISQLETLEELGLWSTSTISLQALVEVQEKGNDDEAPGTPMCPRLDTLRLHTRSESSTTNTQLERELSEFLVMRFFLLKSCTFKEAKDRTYTALVAYEKKRISMTKAQRKKLINTTAANTAKSSCYKGVYDAQTKRETFTSVLPRLVVSRGTSKYLFRGDQSLLNQLISFTTEYDVTKDFELTYGPRY